MEDDWALPQTNFKCLYTLVKVKELLQVCQYVVLKV